MKNLKLESHMKTEFLEYSKERNSHDSGIGLHHDSYLTVSILSKVFDYMLDHQLQTNDKSYCWLDNKKDKDWASLGFVDYRMSDYDEFIDALFHHMWCEAEWLARSRVSIDVEYKDVCIQWYGRKFYNSLFN
jgi:hypothetical protein